jgi:hypothetical protein
MKIFIPQSPMYPLVKLTASAGSWQESSLFDHSHTQGEMTTPATIDEDEVTVVAEFCNGRGVPQLPPITVKEATAKPKRTAVKAEPKVEAKTEPKVESKYEAKVDAKADIKGIAASQIILDEVDQMSDADAKLATEKVEVKPANGWNKLHS